MSLFSAEFSLLFSRREAENPKQFFKIQNKKLFLLEASLQMRSES
jgi:hypothetical protein